MGVSSSAGAGSQFNAPEFTALSQSESKTVGFDSRGDGVKELEEMFSKLNPLAEEFVPPSLTNPNPGSRNGFYTGSGLDRSMRFGDGGFNQSVGMGRRVL